MKGMEKIFFKSAPKISKIESQYSESQGDVVKLKEKIGKNLEKRKDISEQDRIRLTRVLQIIERYKPNREIFNNEKTLVELLKSLYRFLPKRGKKKEEVKDNPYLLAEETIGTLRKLRNYDHLLKEFSDSSLDENQILDQQIGGDITSSETLDTSLTLEYEKKNWGVDRICLDGIQNHLTSDSGGEKVWVQCLVNDVWVSLDEAKNEKDKIKSVRFADDGVGFDVKNLVLLWSTKSEESGSKGQFGEGMKMIAASSVREGLDMELQSQNWSAKPFGKEINIFNTRKNENQNVQQLSFNVDHHNQENIIGSRTIFHKPSKEFIDEVLKMKEKVLELSENYKPLFVGNRGQIANTNSGNIFVKGIFVKNENTIFSYNFEDVETNRDRNTIVNEDIGGRVRAVIEELNDKRLIKTLLQKSLDQRETLECHYYLKTKYPSLWQEAFYDAFGKDACVDTKYEPPEIFKNNKVTKINFPEGVMRLLIQAGVKTDKETIPPFYEETIPTSVTLEYGKDVWNEERIILDAIQNHLPQDSEGQSIYLRFKTKEGEWYSFKDLEKFKNEDIANIKIANQGSRGYDHRLLGIFQSVKEHDQSSGKWGEGLKMLSSACLRNGINMSLKSRKWRANPKIQEQTIDDTKVKQLVFEVIHEIKNGTIDDGDPHSEYEQSATSFSNPSDKLLKEFRSANKKVLAIESKKPLVNTKEGQILRLIDGELFIRDIFVPGNHDLKYSYHFPKFDIKTRDRNAITKQDLQGELSKLWSEVEDPDVVKDFLYQANLSVANENEADFTEFQTYFNPKNSDVWIKVYKEIFGEKTAVRNVNSQDFNEMHQLEHVGLKMITMPTAIFSMLNNLRSEKGETLPDYSEKIKELTDVKQIEDESLTKEEKEIIQLLYQLDKFLPNNRENKIAVYDKKFADQHIALGYTDHSTVFLSRDCLSNILDAVDVYYHEKTHVISGAKDAEAGFRNFLTRALAEMALKQIEIEK